MNELEREAHQAAIEELRASGRKALRARLQALMPKPAAPEAPEAEQPEAEPSLEELEQLAEG